MNSKLCYIILLSTFCSFSLDAMNSEDRKIIEDLLASNISTKELSAYNNKLKDTPLYVAIFHRDVDLTQRLLKCGVDPNVECAGKSPLHLAARNGYKEMVQLLIFHNANVNMQNSSGWTPVLVSVYDLIMAHKKANECKDPYYGAQTFISDYYVQKIANIKACIKILLYFRAKPTLSAIKGWAIGKHAIDLAQEYRFLDEIVKCLQNPWTKACSKKCLIALLSKGYRQDGDTKKCLLPKDVATEIASYIYGPDEQQREDKNEVSDISYSSDSSDDEMQVMYFMGKLTMATP